MKPCNMLVIMFSRSTSDLHGRLDSNLARALNSSDVLPIPISPHKFSPEATAQRYLLAARVNPGCKGEVLSQSFVDTRIYEGDTTS